MFPVGVTILSCTVTDRGDDPATVSETFQVLVTGARAQLQALLLYVQKVGPGPSLIEKVSDMIADYDHGKGQDLCHDLGSLAHEPAAQAGKHLSRAQANAITATASRVAALIAGASRPDDHGDGWQRSDDPLHLDRSLR